MIPRKGVHFFELIIFRLERDQKYSTAQRLNMIKINRLHDFY